MQITNAGSMNMSFSTQGLRFRALLDWQACYEYGSSGLWMHSKRDQGLDDLSKYTRWLEAYKYIVLTKRLPSASEAV